MRIEHQRLRHQRLIGPKLATPQDTVRWLGAVQAQDYQGGKWALALRTRGVDDAALDRAFNDGAFLRTHIMRPTWHFVAPQDLRWLLALTSPRVQAVNGRVYRMVELDAALFRRAHRILTSALRDGKALTRLQLGDILEANGITARGLRLAYLVMHAELSGLLCSGPLRGKQHTYALLEERVPPAPDISREEALATLVRRYFTSHGPATAHDFSWWSGLTVTESKAGIASVANELEAVTIEGKTYWDAAPARTVTVKEPVVHLLPNYDEHIVAYRDHGPSMDPRARAALRTLTNTPLAVHIVTRNGLVVGGWKRGVTKAGAVVQLDLLVPLSVAERSALMRAVKDYGRFMGMPVVATTPAGGRARSVRGA